MGCAASTEPDPRVIAGTAGFDLDRAWDLDPRVSVRPEDFGALLYHFGNRKLSFLKDPKLRAVVESLATSPTARQACLDAGISPGELPLFARALAELHTSEILIERAVS